MTRERLIRCIAEALPRPLAAAPERVLINFACILIGIASLIAERPGSLLTLWPWWVAVEWSLVMTGGGLAALIGYWCRQSSRRPVWASLERVGYMAILLAALLYGTGVIAVFGWSGFFSGVIYLGIAVSKFVRVVVSSSARDHLLRAAPGEPGADGR